MASLIRIVCWLAPSLVLLGHGVHKVLDWPLTVDAASSTSSLLRHVWVVGPETIARVAVGSEIFCGVLLLLERSGRAALATATLLLVFTGVLFLLGTDGSWYAPYPCSGVGGYPIWLAIARNAALIACCCLLLRWDKAR